MAKISSKKADKNSDFAKAYISNIPDFIKKQFDKHVLTALVALNEKASQARKDTATDIQVFNPTEKKNGWTSHHTVLNIVCDDKAFIIDSVIALLTSKSHQIELIAHPLVFVERNKSGAVTSVSATRNNGAKGQSHIFVQLNRRLTMAEMEALHKELGEVYQDVHFSNRDWLAIKDKVNQLASDDYFSGKIEEGMRGDYNDFLKYIHDDNFTLLGYCEYDYNDKKKTFAADKKSGLGFFSAEREEDFFTKEEKNHILDAETILSLQPITISKMTRQSSVHRRVPLDIILVQKTDKAGKINGLVIVVGLFTSVTYSRGLNTVPFLRYKAESVLKKAGYEGGGHSGRALRHILEKFPRDELFQIDQKDLYATCMSIMQLQEQPRIAVYFCPDVFGRRIVAITYVPKDLYDTRLRIKFACVLEEELNARYVDFHSAVDDSPLVRLTFTLAWNAGASRQYNIAHTEKRLQEIGKSWVSRLNDLLIERLSDENKAAELTLKYGYAFPESYQEMYQARQSIHDIDHLEKALEKAAVEVDLHRPYNADGREVSLKIYSPVNPIALSDVLPVLENMGLRIIAEYPFEIRARDAGKSIWIQDFLAEISGKLDGDLNKEKIFAVRDEFEACLKGIWSGHIENDGLNKLILLSGMKWSDVVILRACVRYMRQTKIPYSLSYMEQALTENPEIAANLVKLFHTKFCPQSQSSKTKNEISSIKQKIVEALQAVSSIDQDRILRAVLEIIDAALRTNFYQTDENGHAKPWVSIKLDSSQITDIPEPKPYREITVYSPRIEGIHLRSAPISRGGLRWSDRHEDFRTEVLGLVKAQNVKNSVIVPLGSKGGFVVKNPPKTGGRAAYMEEGIACYKTFIRALLDVTDNRKGAKIIPPENVVRWDNDDPYLVVAADKGTATFSDYANAISMERGFWLGDAFASGGSAGYDHKKMGITARGAWESVKRHFREMGVNCQTEEFDCIAIGDMAGDVFGNGLLQSKTTRLIGAFNHMHIFVDPSPDAAVSYKERERLFKAVKGWDAYDEKKLSKGGRIYLRSEKALKLTPEIKSCFGIDKDVVTPTELIRALLKAEVDLLFFGGIGTYIKSDRESQMDAGDRANDALRIDAEEVRAKIIGEGANLAVTQRGRIQLAELGCRLNTDFIDNSAGVDTSDHEVNIKILMSDVMSDPKSKMNVVARDKLLTEMTDEVAQLVLNDNYQQTQAISLLEAHAAELMLDHANFMHSLEREGLLNRQVEFLPDDETIEQRLKLQKGLTRPELSLILSYGKMTYTKSLLASPVLDKPDMIWWLTKYFPKKLQQKYRTEIENHRLRREIIATGVSNAVVNRMGPTFIRLACERTGHSVSNVTEAYLTVRDAFKLLDLWTEIEWLDNKVKADVQLKAIYKSTRLAERETYWLLNHGQRGGKALTERNDLIEGVNNLKKHIGAVLPKEIADDLKQRASKWEAEGLPSKLAKEVALLPLLATSFDIIRISEQLKVDLAKTAQIYFEMGSYFHLEALRQKAINIQQDGTYIGSAVKGLVDSLYHIQAELAVRLIKDNGKKPYNATTIEHWIASDCPRASGILDKIRLMDKMGSDFAGLVMIEQQLRQLL